MSSTWAPSAVPADATSVKTIVLRVGDPVMQVDAVRTFIDSTGAVPVIIQGRTMLPVRAIVEAWAVPCPGMPHAGLSASSSARRPWN